MNSRMQLTRETTITTAPGGIVVLHVSGGVDPDACQRFEMVITKALQTNPRVIVVDLSAAPSVSTVMIGMLLKLRLNLAAIGGEVRLAQVQPMVRRVLNVCRMDRLFPVFSSAQEAMES